MDRVQGRESRSRNSVMRKIGVCRGHGEGIIAMGAMWLCGVVVVAHHDKGLCDKWMNVLCGLL